MVTLIEKDQPYLTDKIVNHPEEPVCLLAHPNKDLLERARPLVKIEYDLLPAIFSIEDSIAKKQIIWGDDNIFKSYRIDKGDIKSAFNGTNLTMEQTYSTGAQEQLYIECQGMIAIANPQDGVTVWGSLQCPYYVHKALMVLFALPENKVRVIQTETGGAFGGKEDYPSIIAGHAALLAWKSGKPVKIIYDRAEDMVATTKRHPSQTKIRTAVNKDGKIVGIDIDFTIDGGAYCTLSPVVLSRGTLHAAGPYFCENVRIRSRAVATNTPPHGAFRGFGAPQSIFAIERHMDKVAKQMGLTPEEFRRRNFLKMGQSTATSQIIREDVNFPELMAKAFELSKYTEKRNAFSKLNKQGKIKRGIGFSCFMHGAGFTGSGERTLASVVGVEACNGGNVRVLTASTEMGQGTNTIFSQIAADALGIGVEDIDVAQPDTKYVPNSGPTVASRTAMIVGNLVQSCCAQLKDKLNTEGFLPIPHTRTDFKRACQKFQERVGPLKVYNQYQAPSDIFWDDQNYKGDAYATYAWAVYVAEVSIDMTTYETRVENVVAVQEVGKVIHPVLAAGQIEGGIAQAIGYALYEKVCYEQGRMANGQMTNYIMPTSMDFGPIQVFFLETNKRFGPAGAKGIGELPMDGPAPAILNAVENALGVSIHCIPLLPETLEDALERDGASQ